MVTQGATREYVSDALPAINQRVQILLSLDSPGQLAAGVPSRIEDVVLIPGKNPEQEIHVAPPRYNGDVERPREGHAMGLVWATERGVLELPVAFQDVVRVGEVVSAWRVRVVGPAVRVQRRHFVRVAFAGPILVRLRVEDDESATPGGAGPSAAVPGMTIDMSEGGLRCVLETELIAETPVNVSFAFNGDDFALDARIVRAFAHTERAGYRGEPRWDTAIRFVNPDLAGDALRKGIFAEQLRARRATGR